MQSANAQAGALQGVQAEVPLSSLGAVTEQENLGSASLGISPHEAAFRAVTFADAVCEYMEDDAMSSVSEKGAVMEGHRNVLRLLYQLCPAAAPESPPTPRRVCDFEGLFASMDRPSAAEGEPTLFHRVAELRAEHLQRFHEALETGKLPSSALTSRRRDHDCCSDPSVAAATPINTGILRLVGSLSNKHPLSFSFKEAARVESLCKGLLSAQSSDFWLLSSLLHWLKELEFSAPDPSLFSQLVQEISGSMVTAANSATALSTYLVAKRREGILSHFPSHVRSHFKEELTSSFEIPFLFDDEVLAKVIAASRKDSNLDAQLSIAKVFTLPVFRGGAKNSGWTTSSGLGSSASSASSSGFCGKGRGSDSSGTKRKTSSGPGWARREKSPRRGSFPSAKRRGSRK